MKKKALIVCKYCFAKRVLEKPPKNGLEAAFTEQMLTWEPKEKSFMAPCYCKLKPTEGFNEKKALPKKCPYSTEHVVELKC